MKYTQLKSHSYSIGDYSVVSLRREDLSLIKEWRNDQIKVLRQNQILSDQDQLNYFETFVRPSFTDLNSKIILFSFLYKDKCIGYGGLTNIHWEDQRTELSFLVDTERTKDNKVYHSDFTHFIELMKMVVFDDLEFNRIFTETYDIRQLHVSILEECGFELEGRMREHVKIDNKRVDSLLHGFIKKDYEIKR
jgi:RimJ/RimL family protein N-acetyltransferase